MKNNKEKISRKYMLIGIMVCLLLLGFTEIAKIVLFAKNDMVFSFLSRIVGIILCFFIIFYCSFNKILKLTLHKIPKSILFIIPCLIVAINNFPLVQYIFGDVYITGEIGDVIICFFDALCTGLFEELAFRGIVFMLTLEKIGKTKKGVFLSVLLSSAIFGLIHVFNIFAGANPLSVIMQVGYSFLVGGMCAVVLIKTESIWYSVLIHALYNFAGDIIPILGGGILWDIPRIVITVLLTVTVAIYLICTLLRIDFKKLDKMFN